MPAVELALSEYRRQAFSTDGGALARALRFASLRARARKLARAIDVDIARFVHEVGPTMGWDQSKQEQRVRRGGGLIRSYLRAIIAAAQFGTFERIFSLWHVMHMPLVYLLVLSAAYHVLAVHMY